MSPTTFLLSLILLSFPVIAFSDEDCVYTLYIRTGSIFKGGTDSIISVRFYDSYGDYVGVSNIEAWGGLMGRGHDYFERGDFGHFQRESAVPELAGVCPELDLRWNRVRPWVVC
ncbi:PLAT DOMAIN-CONTAINING PROTEIN 2 [Salix viminalis]|uniref:PLAT DOMAIN-CONTAINING PROTEIN 2 n=1 Tax=Salix viminalis TaxID=40686 RepID=A0A9Q0NXW8_SALVM|nr:PLAT DOMAIN-CONTAINING PROTEIN 2 [Salix viminalis]